MAVILIAGGDALAAGVERELRARGRETARLTRAAHDLDPADIAGAAALILAANDDGGNVSLALRARHMEPGLPIVVRIFDAALALYLTQTLEGVRVLSMSSVTAPRFVEAAAKVASTAAPAAPLQIFMPREIRRRGFRIDPVLVVALVCFFALVFPSAFYFANALGIRYLDALYFVWTTVMTVGYGDFSLKEASDGAKIFGMVLMLAGASFIAVLFAILSDWVFSRRIDMMSGRTPERGAGHVIVAGAGNIGFRVAGLLAGSGKRLVVIEREAQSRNAAQLVAAGHHVILADATSEETLELAGLRAASVVLALTNSDAANLQVALQARAAGVPVVMRADSVELAGHVAARGDAVALAPVAAATAAFCEAALECVRRREEAPLRA